VLVCSVGFNTSKQMTSNILVITKMTCKYSKRAYCWYTIITDHTQDNHVMTIIACHADNSVVTFII